MPRSRVTEEGQRQDPRGPPSQRTSSSDSDPSHVRPRSTKVADGRSQRGIQSNPPSQKKLGTRIADLESQLGLAQQELKCLKVQIGSTDAAKKSQKAPEHSTPTEDQKSSNNDRTSVYEIQQETDVFEVPTDKTIVNLPTESPATAEVENPLVDELASKNEEINLLKTNLDEREKELDVFRQENGRLKRQLDEKLVKISSSQSEIDELNQRLNSVSEELEQSKSSGVMMNVKLEAAAKAKEMLENEMKMLRVQTEQWRKAADAAACVLSGGVERNGIGRRISERCGSMDKLYCNALDPVGGYTGYVGSPGLIDDVFGGEKRKGIRMFGDLWKKKNHM